MIGYLKGSVIFIAAEHAIVETNGVGYRVFMSTSSLAKLEKNLETKLHIYTNVREDAIILYGFFDYAEYDVFLKLITVSGIGPKVALGILSAIAPDAFRLTILNQDINTLNKLPGVGKKTAERLLLELRDKLGFDSNSKQQFNYNFPTMVTADTPYEEALAALMALGYEKSEVMPLFKQYVQDGMLAEEMIKAVLKGFARR